MNFVSVCDYAFALSQLMYCKSLSNNNENTMHVIKCDCIRKNLNIGKLNFFL